MIIQLQRSRLRVQSVVNARPFACWERYHIRLCILSVEPLTGGIGFEVTIRTRVRATGLRQVTTFSFRRTGQLGHGRLPCSFVLSPVLFYHPNADKPVRYE